MTQRFRSSAVFVLLGATGFLTMVGAVVFSVVQLKYLTAAETPAIVPVVGDQRAEADDFRPPALAPVPELQPLPAAKPVAVPRSGIQAGSLRRVPDFSEMEAKAEAALNTPITVSFKEIDLKSALAQLSELSGVPVHPAPLDKSWDYDTTKPFTLDFKEEPLSTVLRSVYRFATGLNSGSLGAGFNVTAAATENGIEVGISGYGMPEKRETRIYLVKTLLSDPEEAEEIIKLLHDRSGGYWRVTTENGRGGVRAFGAVMTPEDDDDVYLMGQASGSIAHLKSMGALVVDANPQAHFEIFKMLRLLSEAQQVAAQQD